MRETIPSWLLTVSTANLVDELSESELRSSRTTASMKSPVSSVSKLAADDDDEPHEQQSAAKTASVRFLDENLESVHHFEVQSPKSSTETVLAKWEQQTEKKWDATGLREQTRLQLQDLRNDDMMPPNYDPAWD